MKQENYEGKDRRLSEEGQIERRQGRLEKRGREGVFSIQCDRCVLEDSLERLFEESQAEWICSHQCLYPAQ